MTRFGTDMHGQGSIAQTKRQMAFLIKFMMSESAFFEARGSVVLQFVIVISLAQAEEETWLSVKPEERPLVNLVTPRFSPAARVLNELGELVRGPPEEAFPLLDSVLARHLTSSSSSSSSPSSSILSQCV